MSPTPQFNGPWLPWFHGDFLRATQGWTVTERGVYFLLLGASWEMGPLPDDRRRLAGIVGAQLDEFDDAWKTVRSKFTLTDRGLINPRLELHRDKQALRSEKARQSVMNRWQGNLALDTNVSTNEDTDVHTNEGTSVILEGIRSGIRSGYSSDLRSQNSEKGKNSSRPAAAFTSATFHDEVVAAYHRQCPHLAGIKTWPKHRRAKLNARIRERCADGKPADTVNYWDAFFASVAASDFLSGRTAKPFTANIDWLLGPENFPKVIEGNYANRKSNGSGGHG
jgi:uncharacterized protein YdaU (DUF1376 family)